MTLNDNSLLIVLSEDRLRSIITDAVRQALSEMPQPKTTAYDENEMLTRKAAAEWCKISQSTIDNYRRAGLIAAHRLGKSVRYKRGDLMKAFSNSLANPRKNRRNWG